MKDKKLLAMIGKRNELKAQAQGILDGAQKEERPLTDADKETLEGIKASIARWDDTIKEMAELLEDSAPVDVPVNAADAPKGDISHNFTNFGEPFGAVSSPKSAIARMVSSH